MNLNKLWSMVLLVAMLALAGCPDMVQQGGDSSPSGESRGGGGGE